MSGVNARRSSECMRACHRGLCARQQGPMLNQLVGPPMSLHSDLSCVAALLGLGLQAVPNEVDWGNDAISKAVWTGCSLADVLHFVGCVDQAKHLEFIASDVCQKEGTQTQFGGSIPLVRALAGDV